MIEYSLFGAWGKTIPDEKLKEALTNFGIQLEVEARKDGLSNVKISIDDEKILHSKKRTGRKRKPAEVEEVNTKKVDNKKQIRNS